jgi:hypothetical protein
LLPPTSLTSLAFFEILVYFSIHVPPSLVDHLALQGEFENLRGLDLERLLNRSKVRIPSPANRSKIKRDNVHSSSSFVFTDELSELSPFSQHSDISNSERAQLQAVRDERNKLFISCLHHGNYAHMPYKLQLFESDGRFGVRTLEPIPKEAIVLEFGGERLSEVAGAEREKMYENNREKYGYQSYWCSTPNLQFWYY